MTNKEIDPRFYVPPVADFEYKDTSGNTSEGAAAPTDLTIPVTPTTGLQPPETVTVIEQITRKGADGRSVVDLVVEVQDMPGATEYEVRVALV